MNTKKFGVIIILVAFAFAFIETIYFGSNWAPKTLAEKICDCSAIVIWAVGLYLFCYGKSEQ